MALDDLKPLVDAGVGDVTLAYLTIEDTATLNLDTESGKSTLYDWAKANGYSISADQKAREVTFHK